MDYKELKLFDTILEEVVWYVNVRAFQLRLCFMKAVLSIGLPVENITNKKADFVDSGLWLKVSQNS